MLIKRLASPHASLASWLYALIVFYFMHTTQGNTFTYAYM